MQSGIFFILTTEVLTPEKRKAVKLSIITANHVTSGFSKILIKFGRPETTALWFPYQPISLDDSVDLVLIPIPDDKVSEFRDQNLVLKADMVCRDITQMEAWHLHEGTKVFAAGYLTGINSDAIMPFYRFGQYSSVNIGKMQLKDWKEPQNADWIAMSGSKGMSGSPVFLDTQSSTNDIKVVGILKDVYDTVEDTMIRQQDLMLSEPARNLSRLLQKYHDDLKGQGYTIQ